LGPVAVSAPVSALCAWQVPAVDPTIWIPGSVSPEPKHMAEPPASRTELLQVPLGPNVI
jgi:hypothetical protein